MTTSGKGGAHLYGLTGKRAREKVVKLNPVRGIGIIAGKRKITAEIGGDFSRNGGPEGIRLSHCSVETDLTVKIKAKPCISSIP